MPDITEIRLPGVGVRHEFVTGEGARVAVLTHRGGHRDVVVYDRGDADRASASLRLTLDDAHTLVDLLGGTRVSEALVAVQQQIEGLAIDWLTVASTSPSAGATIAEGGFRSRTGASIVAVVRGEVAVPAPEPDYRLEAGDIAVAVGTTEGLAQLRQLLAS